MILTFANFLPHIMPHLRACPENFVANALKEISREFFGFTEVWRKELTAINVVADTAQYALDPAEDPGEGELEPEIRRIYKVEISDSEQDSSTYKLTINTLTSPTTTYSITFLTGHVPSVSATAGLEVEVILVPDFVSGYLPVYMRNRWGEALVAGTLARLLGMQGTPWYSPNLAQEKMIEYLAAKNQGVKERYTGRVGGTLQAGSPFAFDV